MFVVHDEGRRHALVCLIRAGLTLRLFVSDREPQPGYSLQHYREAQGHGYAPIPLSGQDWTVSAEPPFSAAFGRQSWTFDGPLGSVFGWFLTGPGGELLGAERFPDGPYKVQRKGDRIEVAPVLASRGVAFG